MKIEPSRTYSMMQQWFCVSAFLDAVAAFANSTHSLTVPRVVMMASRLASSVLRLRSVAEQLRSKLRLRVPDCASDVSACAYDWT